MAIHRTINYSNSGLTGQSEAVRYIRNDEKSDGIPYYTAGISEDPMLSFTLNRFLQGNIKAKRWFKTEIVSLEQTWPKDKIAFQDLCLRMEALMRASIDRWKEQGFQATGAVHTNTEHPHFHIVVDTCNFNTGKQMSQDKQLLSKMKDYLSDVMGRLGIGEGVLQSKYMREQEMYLEDDLSVDRTFSCVDTSEIPETINNDEYYTGIPFWGTGYPTSDIYHTNVRYANTEWNDKEWSAKIFSQDPNPPGDLSFLNQLADNWETADFTSNPQPASDGWDPQKWLSKIIGQDPNLPGEQSSPNKLVDEWETERLTPNPQQELVEMWTVIDNNPGKLDEPSSLDNNNNPGQLRVMCTIIDSPHKE